MRAGSRQLLIDVHECPQAVDGLEMVRRRNEKTRKNEEIGHARVALVT